MRQALELAIEWIEKQPEEITASKYDVNSRYVVLKELEAALAQPERDYERGFIDGMQKQMQSSVDKAVNAMSRTWVGLTMQDAKVIENNAPSIQMAIFMAEATLKDKNNG